MHAAYAAWCAGLVPLPCRAMPTNAGTWHAGAVGEAAGGRRATRSPVVSAVPLSPRRWHRRLAPRFASWRSAPRCAAACRLMPLPRHWPARAACHGTLRHRSTLVPCRRSDGGRRGGVARRLQARDRVSAALRASRRAASWRPERRPEFAHTYSRMIERYRDGTRVNARFDHLAAHQTARGRETLVPVANGPGARSGLPRRRRSVQGSFVPRAEAA